MGFGDFYPSDPTIELRPGVIGEPVFVGGLWDSLNYSNEDPQRVQVSTNVITGAVDDTEYSLTVSVPAVTTVSFTSGTGATTTTIAEGLRDAWNANAVARGLMQATSATATITLTGKFPGVEITIAEGASAGNMTLTSPSVSALVADDTPFARALVSTTRDSTGRNRSAVIASTAALGSAQVDTVTISYTAANQYHVTVIVEGVSYGVAVLANTDTATTADDLVTQLTAVLPSTVVVADTGTGFTLTSQLAGLTFTTQVSSAVATDMVLVLTTPGVDFWGFFAGVSIKPANIAGTDLNTTRTDIPGLSMVEGAIRGDMWVENTQGVASGDAVYVELAVGDDSGKFFNTSSATRILDHLGLTKWQKSDGGADGNAAHLSIAVNA